MNDAELAALYEKYGFLVHRRCLALLRNPTDAEDALQETFLRVRRYGRGADQGSTLGWLYTIASHCCFDLMNKRDRERPAGDEELASLEGSGSGAPDDGDRRAVLGALLRQLDGKTREIGVLHFLDGFTQEEVAARTGYSRRTVGKKLKVFEELFRKFWPAQVRGETR